MIQYAYGNFKHEGFRYVSSSSAFFSDAGRQAQLAHLHQFDASAARGESEVGEYRCYLMTSSNLNTPGELTRLYYQASSLDPYRTAFFVRGYVSDESDTDVYGSTLLQLLRANIPALRETEADLAAVNRSLEAKALPQDNSINGEGISEELLEHCLRTLITDRENSKKLYIRLDKDGTEAMRYARKLLYALYSRLPYDIRERNGFFTGLTAAVQNDSKNALPAGIHVFLLDHSSDASVHKSLFVESIDLSKPLPSSSGTDERFEVFLRFLLHGSEKDRTAFFSELDKAVRKCSGLRLTKELYGYIYLLYSYSQQGKTLDAEDIRSLIEAVSALDRRGQERSFMLSLMWKWVPLETIKNEFLASISSFSGLWELGSGGKHRARSAAAQESSTGILWQLLSAYLQLMGEDERTAYENELYPKLKKKYSELLLRDYPSLCTTTPRAEDIKNNEDIPAFAQGSGVVQRLWDEFNRLILECKNTVAKKYTTNREEQLSVGNARIAGMNTLTQSDWAALFSELKEKYLWEELLPGEWSRKLAEKFTELLRTEMRRSQGKLPSLSENMQGVHALLEENGVTLSEADESEYRQRLTLLGLLMWHSDTQLLTMPNCSDDAVRQLTENKALAKELFGEANWYFDTNWSVKAAQCRCKAIDTLHTAGIGGSAFSIGGTDSFSAAELHRLLSSLESGTKIEAEAIPWANEPLCVWLSERFSDNAAFTRLRLQKAPWLASDYNDILRFEEIRPYLFYLHPEQLLARFKKYVRDDLLNPDELLSFLAAGLSIEEMTRNAPEKKRAYIRKCFGVDGPVKIDSPVLPPPEAPGISLPVLILPALSALALALSVFRFRLFPTVAAAAALILLMAFCFLYGKFARISNSQRNLAKYIGFSPLPGVLTAAAMVALQIFSILGGKSI